MGHSGDSLICHLRLQGKNFLDQLLRKAGAAVKDQVGLDFQGV